MRVRRLVFWLVSISTILASQQSLANPSTLSAQSVGPGGAPPPGSGPVDVTGFVRVADGDTFQVYINGQQVIVGLAGVEAPQGNTACGREATNQLRALVRGGLRLQEDQQLAFDGKNRRVYHAVTSDGRSVGQELTRNGVARADGRSSSRQAFAAAESEARSRGTGCLSGVRGEDASEDALAAAPSTAEKGLAAPLPAPAAEAQAAPLDQTTSLPSGFSQDVIASGLIEPTSFIFLPDGRILVAEKAGRVRVIKNGALLTAPMLDVQDRVNDFFDHGLLSIAADPNFATNGFVYLLYTYENDALEYDGPKTARLTRVTAVGDTASPASESVVLGTTVGQSCNDFPAGTDCLVSDNPSHSVGSIRFAPDGTMFVSTGDGASFNLVDSNALRAQNLDSLAGKVLHINPNGTGVSTNPFWNGNPSSNRSKVYAYGVRNSFKFTLRPGTSIPYLGDVGWNMWEEINTLPAPGANLGWPCYEGNFQQSGYAPFSQCQTLYSQGPSAVRFPIRAYDHATGRAVIGGMVYTGNTFPSAYQGAFFYGDYGLDWIRTLRTDASHNMVPGSDASFASGIAGPVAIEQGPDQNLYYLAIGAGALRRIRFTSGNTPPTAVAGANVTDGLAPVAVDFSSAGSVDPDNDPIQFSWNFGDGTPASTQANPSHTYTANGTYTATLTVTDSRAGTGTDTVVITVGNRRPTASITTPVSTMQFKVGDVIAYSGSATDPDQGTIGSSGFSWQIILHHCPQSLCHTHFFWQSDGPTGSFTVPDHGDQSYFELIVTATDDGGLTDAASVSIQPQTASITLSTAPSGLQLVYDGISNITPFTRTTIAGSTHSISAPSPQGSGTFVGWSDGGANAHDVVVGAAGSNLTASFNVAANSSLALDGVGAFAEAPHAAELNTTADWTVETWLKDESPLGYNHPRQRIITKGNTSSDAEIPYFLAIDSNILYTGARAANNTTLVEYDLAAGGVSVNAWHHLAASMNASTRLLTVYIDGVQVAQGPVTPSTVGNTGLIDIGHNPTDGQYWRGKFDDVRIWNVARTASEIQANHQNELVGTPAGLVGNWRFNEGTGLSAADSAGAPQNATLANGAVFSSDVHGGAGAPTSTPAPTSVATATPTSTSTPMVPTATPGGSTATATPVGPTATATPVPTSSGAAASLVLNGTTSSVQAPHAAEINTTGDWTVETWFKDETPGGYGHPRARVITKGDTTLDGNVPYFVTIDSGSLFAGVRTNNSSFVLRYDLVANGVSANAWHHVAATLTASTRMLTLYLDGNQVAQTQVFAVSATGNTGPLNIGFSPADGHFFRGKLDDMRIWNVARTGAQIQANFQTEFSTSPAGLVGNWRFDEGAGATAADSAGTPQDATLQGGATWSTTDVAVPAPPASGPTATPTSVPPATPTPTMTPTFTPTSTSLPTATSTSVPTADVPAATSTATSSPTSTSVPTATSTSVPAATSTPTSSPTATSVPTSTSTTVPTNTATPVGPTATATPVPTSSGAAASLVLNGTTSSVQAPHAAEINTTGDWTVETWFKDETPGGYGHPRARILSKGDATLDGNVPYFMTIDSGSLFAGVRTNNSSFVLRYDLVGNGVTANAWHHVAATLTASTRVLTLYLDGNQVAQTQVFATSATGNTGPLSIGFSPADGHFFRGKLDDVRIWNVARTSAQIQANFQTEFSTSPAGLVGNWRFDEGAGATAADSAGTPQDATLAGGATWSTTDVAVSPSGGPIPTATVGPSSTPTATPTVGPSSTPTRTPTASPTATAAPTSTAVPTSTPVPTPIGGAASLLLNGTSASASAPHATEINTTGDWTVEIWFRDETPGGYMHPRARLITKGDTTLDGNVPYFMTIDSGSLFAGVRTNNSSFVLRYDLVANGVSANVWHHVAATLTASTRMLTLYLDGNQVAQTQVFATSTTGNTGPLNIGFGPADGHFFRGKLDDVRIWNVVRTSAQIQANFRAEFSAAQAGLVGNWRFNEGAGIAAADSAGTPQNAALAGGAGWSADVHP